MGSKVCCVAGFRHHHVTITSPQCMCIAILCLKVELKQIHDHEQLLYEGKV